jgi:prenyltransferase beta subunit
MALAKKLHSIADRRFLGTRQIIIMCFHIITKRSRLYIFLSICQIIPVDNAGFQTALMVSYCSNQSDFKGGFSSSPHKQNRAEG